MARLGLGDAALSARDLALARTRAVCRRALEAQSRARAGAAACRSATPARAPCLERLDLRAQRHLALGAAVDGRAAAAAAGGERRDSWSIWAFCWALIELASSSAVLWPPAPAVSSAISRSRLNSSRLASLSRASTRGSRSATVCSSTRRAFWFSSRSALSCITSVSSVEMLASRRLISIIWRARESLAWSSCVSSLCTLMAYSARRRSRSALISGSLTGIDCLMRAVVSRTARDQKADATSSPSRLAARKPRATSMAD